MVRLTSGSPICSARARASLARSSQCLGSLIGCSGIKSLPDLVGCTPRQLTPCQQVASQTWHGSEYRAWRVQHFTDGYGVVIALTANECAICATSSGG